MKKFLLFLMAIGMFAIAGCGTDTTPNDPGNNGACKNPVLSEINLTGDPLSLLGIYNVEAFGKNGEPTNKLSQKSELRVGLNMSNSASGKPEVLMSLDFEGQKMSFENYPIDLSGIVENPNFIADTFAGLGAEIIKDDKFGLIFTLNPTDNKQYQPIIDQSIITNGQFLKLKLKKIQNIEADKGLEGQCAPDTIEVTGINITTPEKEHFKGSNVTIDFELTPANTTETKVKWSSINKGNGEITATNGKGTLILDNVTVSDTITFTTEKNHSKTYNIQITETLTEINFRENSYQLNIDETKTIKIENHDLIASIGTITYSVEGSDNILQVNGQTGEITGLKKGTEILVATVVLNGTKAQLTAKTQIVVSENTNTNTQINFSDPNTLKGTYKIEYFASAAGSMGGASSSWAKLDNYKNVLSRTNSMQKPGSGMLKATADANDNFYGKATINIEDSNFKIISKLQMKDPSFKSYTVADLTPQQYNYTVYTPIPTANIIGNVLNNIDSGNSVKGVTGRDAKAKKPDKINANGGSANTYEFTLHTDGKLYHYMKDQSSVMAADVLVVLTKISDNVETLAPNVQFTNSETSMNDIELPSNVFDASEIYK